jgi:hypothetical protein
VPLTAHSQRSPLRADIKIHQASFPSLGSSKIERHTVLANHYYPGTSPSNSHKPLKYQCLTENRSGYLGAKSGHLKVGAERCDSASAENRQRGGLKSLGLARSRRGTCGYKRRARPMSLDFVKLCSRPAIVLSETVTCADAGWLRAHFCLDEKTCCGSIQCAYRSIRCWGAKFKS